jgi:hypothetical protein
MLSLALTLALAASPGEANPPSVHPPAVARPGEVTTLDTPAQVRALCDALEPPERVTRGRDAVERGRAQAEHEARREAALEGRYRVRVAPERVPFAPYDVEERRLELSDRAWLSGAGGALHVWMTADAGLPVTAGPAAAERIVSAAARRALVLTLTFQLPDDDEVMCAHAAGSHAWTLGVEPQAWELAEGGEVLARGGEGSDRPSVTVAHGALPRVEVSEPVGDAAGRELKGAVAGRAGELERCYRRALAADPALDGTLVAELDLSAGAGAPRAVRIAVDSIQDDAMLACVTGVLAATPFPRGAGAVATIPIHFELQAPDGP